MRNGLFRFSCSSSFVGKSVELMGPVNDDSFSMFARERVCGLYFFGLSVNLLVN